LVFGLSSLFLSSFVSLLWQPTLVFKIAPIMGKKNKIKKGDKINLLSNKMQYQECHGNLTIFVERHA
jgi:hypothetical protein